MSLNEMFAALQQRVARKIKEKRVGFCLHTLLLGLSLGFRSIIWVRHRVYTQKVLIPKRANICVVSIGNIAAGGVGKTPFALMLAHQLQAVAILTRGYRSEAEKLKEPMVVNSAKLAPPEVCGDEAHMMAKKLGDKALVLSGRHRFIAAQMAAAKGCRVALLDDGMQHRKLARDFEIVLLNGADPFGCGAYLPRGFLREDPCRLRSADLLVVVGKVNKKNKRMIEELSGGVPCVQAQMVLSECMDMNKEEKRLDQAKVGVFCAIGNPHRFVESVQAAGADVCAHSFFPDHSLFDEATLLNFSLEAKRQGADFLCCTEKDWGKVSDALKRKLALEPHCIRAELVIEENRQAFDEAVQTIKQLAEEKR